MQATTPINRATPARLALIIGCELSKARVVSSLIFHSQALPWGLNSQRELFELDLTGRRVHWRGTECIVLEDQYIDLQGNDERIIHLLPVSGSKEPTGPSSLTL